MLWENIFSLSNLAQQVMDAEKQKAESGADHQEKTRVFHEAESKVCKNFIFFISPLTFRTCELMHNSIFCRYNISNKNSNPVSSNHVPTSKRSKSVKINSTLRKIEFNSSKACCKRQSRIMQRRWRISRWSASRSTSNVAICLKLRQPVFVSLESVLSRMRFNLSL